MGERLSLRAARVPPVLLRVVLRLASRRVAGVSRLPGRPAPATDGQENLMDDERRVIDRVAAEAEGFFKGLNKRQVCASRDVDQVAAVLGGPLGEDGKDPVQVLDELVAGAEPGLLATPSGRFFGWVIGGVLPAALGADWLTSVWDQNAGLLASSPAAAGTERVATGWILDLLGLPPTAAMGFVTGAMMANFTCLAAARYAVYGRVGWDVDREGLLGAP